jgi:GDPmannose 4,6-dehydratase
MAAQGETHSVREFVELALAEVGREIEWSGKGVDEAGINAKSGETIVRIGPVYVRPTEVDLLIGDSKGALEAENDVQNS